jgi:hypothetical protein
MKHLRLTTLLIALAVALWPADVLGHALAPGDKGYVLCIEGVFLGPFTYLGAKHMVTGVDHLLFLLGVIFFLYRARDVALYVTLFAIGHSVTLLAGVLTGFQVNAFAIDAIIGFSVLYKALDNLGVLTRWFGAPPSMRAATLFFGLMHGLGLATKLLELEVSPVGLVENLVAFNVGVELGQLLALGGMLIVMGYWRRSRSFERHAMTVNVGLAVAGVALMVYQIAGLISGEHTA